MSEMHVEINDKKGIEALGFRYVQRADQCRSHKFNGVSVQMNITDKPEYPLKACEKDLDKMFLSILKWELKDAGIKALHEVKWDRVFFFKNWWTPRDFTARFWVRVLSRDAKNNTEKHKIRV